MIKRIAVRATLTPPSQTLTIRDVDRRDRSAGMAGAACHHLIRRSGGMDVGRTHKILEGGDTIVIEMVGGVDEDGELANNFTPNQECELARLLAAFASTEPAAEVELAPVFKLPHSA